MQVDSGTWELAPVRYQQEAGYYINHWERALFPHVRRYANRKPCQVCSWLLVASERGIAELKDMVVNTVCGRNPIGT